MQTVSENKAPDKQIMYDISCSTEAGRDWIWVTFRMMNVFIKSHSATAAPRHVYARTTIFIKSDDLRYVLFKKGES